MQKFTAYDLTTGVILYHGQARNLEDQVEEGIGVVAGHGTEDTHRIVDGRLRMRPKPQRLRRLKLRAMKDLRRRRNGKLRALGKLLTPVYWESLTAEQQAAWHKYRQELLDLPETVSDPHNVEWPRPPS